MTRPDWERLEREGMEEAARLHAEGHFDVGPKSGWAGEPRLDVSVLREAMERGTDAEGVAAEYAHLMAVRLTAGKSSGGRCGHHDGIDASAECTCWQRAGSGEPSNG